MHSLVARLRGRAASQPPSLPTHSDEGRTSGDVPPVEVQPPTPQETHMEDMASLIIARKIHPHVSALMDSFATEDDRPHGLSPPPSATRTPRSPWVEVTPPAGPSNAAYGSVDLSPELLPTRRTSRRTKSSSSRTSHSGAVSIPYSTFGRQELKISASTVSVARSSSGSADTRSHSLSHSLHGVRNAGLSTTSLHRGEDSIMEEVTPPIHEGVPRPSPTTSDDKNDNSSPSHTVSSRAHSVQQSLLTDSHHSSHSHSGSQVSLHTPIDQHFSPASISPDTFGHPTPSDRFPRSNSVTPPPPLPPLLHPELLVSLNTKAQAQFRDISNSLPAPRRRHASFNGKTYPPARRSRKSTAASSNENTVPFPTPDIAGHVLRNYASMPGVRQIFHGDRPAAALTDPRSRTLAPSSRRASAEWNAMQALSGVTSESTGAWPAEVSKRILRLSFGESVLGARQPSDGTQPAAVAEPHGHNVVQHSSDARPCLPPLTSNSHQVNDEDDPEGGDEHPRALRDSDNPVSILAGGVAAEQRSMQAKDEASGTSKANGFSSATFPRASLSHAQRKSILRPPSASTITQEPEAGPSSLQQNVSPPDTPTRPRTFRSSLRASSRYSSEPVLTRVPETPHHKGKRKAEEIDITPPDQRHPQHATFAIPSPSHKRVFHNSDPPRPPPATTAIPPSAYPQRKRVRLSESSPSPSEKSHSRPGSYNNATDAGSMTSRVNQAPFPAIRALSRAASTRSNQQSTHKSVVSTNHSDVGRDRRRTMSQVSIPVSALVAPHPPSVARSSVYHMRDPRRPPPVKPTPWTPHLASAEEKASPPHAWYFFIGFVLFPLWWIASFLPIPKTRRLGGTDTEKAIVVDNPQDEHDARAWRLRCRILAGVSFLTYVPFIVLIAIFAPR